MTRRSGILVHPTSFPSQFGIGDFGKNAYDFIIALVSAKQSLWQILPLVPSSEGNSPYSGTSAFAGNELLIDPLGLVEMKLLEKNDLDYQRTDSHNVDYEGANKFKFDILRISFKRFQNLKSEKKITGNFELFKKINNFWLFDYSCFRALQVVKNEKSWNKWPEGVKNKIEHELAEFIKDYRNEIEFHNFTQFIFFKQWMKLKHYANINGIKIIGDLPFFVSYDSADTWTHRHLFDLDEDGRMITMSGCPPDSFSVNGQVWGNPQYNWNEMKKQNFQWWVRRVGHSLYLTDTIRLDHFRAFESFWQIDSTEKTAVNGRWVEAPGNELLSILCNKFGSSSFIAEDLGVISEKVTQLRDKYHLPGMKILQYAFSNTREAENSVQSHNYIPNSVVYTGTHDHDTTKGWFDKINRDTKNRFLNISKTIDDSPVWKLIRLGMSSSANTVVIPLQDVFELDSNSRMNIPGSPFRNWEWRFEMNLFSMKIREKLTKLSRLCNRNKLIGSV